MLSAKQECLSKPILFGEGSLRRAGQCFAENASAVYSNITAVPREFF
jgi:hypothetical protein